MVAGNYIENGTLTTEFLNHTGGPGTGHDQVDVSDDVFISQTGSVATLNVVYDPLGGGGTFTPTFGQEFIIIDNGGAIPVDGVFDIATGDGPTTGSGAAGTTFTVDGDTLMLFYDGGDGNDVVLVSASGTATDLYVNDDWTAAATVDGNQETAGIETAYVGVDAFESIADAFAAQPGYTGDVTLNGGTYASVDLTAIAGGDTVNLVGDLEAPVPVEADVTIGTLTGSAGDSIVLNSEGSTATAT